MVLIWNDKQSQFYVTGRNYFMYSCLLLVGIDGEYNFILSANETYIEYNIWFDLN